MRQIALVTSSLLLFIYAGCTATGTAFESIVPPAGKAVIYVYRPDSSYGGSGLTMDIKVDDKKIGGLTPNGFVYSAVEPGRHVVSCKTETASEIPFDAAAGKSYYIEAEIVMGFWIGRPNLKMVPEETGKLGILGRRSSMPQDQAAKPAASSP